METYCSMSIWHLKHLFLQLQCSFGIQLKIPFLWSCLGRIRLFEWLLLEFCRRGPNDKLTGPHLIQVGYLLVLFFWFRRCIRVISSTILQVGEFV